MLIFAHRITRLPWRMSSECRDDNFVLAAWPALNRRHVVPSNVVMRDNLRGAGRDYGWRDGERY